MVDHTFSQATSSSFIPSSTARLDCSARPRHMAPAGSSATPTPTNAPRDPTNERNESTAKSFISLPAERQREPGANGRGVEAGSFIGSTTSTVTTRIAPATKKNVDWKLVTAV